jgi:hypothetical protein
MRQHPITFNIPNDGDTLPFWVYGKDGDERQIVYTKTGELYVTGLLITVEAVANLLWIPRRLNISAKVNTHISIEGEEIEE